MSLTKRGVADAGAGNASCRQVRGLLIPADDRRPSVVLVVSDSAAAFSDAIGGGLIEEIHHDVHEGTAYCLYADEHRRAKQLPPNHSAATLAARLGWIDHAERLDLYGDLFILGAETPGCDTDVPRPVLEAASRAGLFDTGTP